MTTLPANGIATEYGKRTYGYMGFV